MPEEAVKKDQINSKSTCHNSVDAWSSKHILTLYVPERVIDKVLDNLAAKKVPENMHD